MSLFLIKLIKYAHATRWNKTFLSHKNTWVAVGQRTFCCRHVRYILWISTQNRWDQRKKKYSTHGVLLTWSFDACCLFSCLLLASSSTFRSLPIQFLLLRTISVPFNLSTWWYAVVVLLCVYVCIASNNECHKLHVSETDASVCVSTSIKHALIASTIVFSFSWNK